MLCENLNVVNLNITEDYYDYQGLLRLCTGEECLDINLVDLEHDEKLKEIKDHFNLMEDIQTIRRVIKEKVLQAAKIESRILEGKHL